MSGSRPNPPRSNRANGALESLLSDPGKAGDPLRRALWLDGLDRQLHCHLPPALAAHARLGNVDGCRLVYLVDSPVWHSRLRLAGPELLDAAGSIGLDVTELVVRTTRPAPRASHPAAATARQLSPRAGQALREAIELLATQQDDAGNS